MPCISGDEDSCGPASLHFKWLQRARVYSKSQFKNVSEKNYSVIQTLGMVSNEWLKCLATDSLEKHAEAVCHNYVVF